MRMLGAEVGVALDVESVHGFGVELVRTGGFEARAVEHLQAERESGRGVYQPCPEGRVESVDVVLVYPASNNTSPAFVPQENCLAHGAGVVKHTSPTLALSWDDGADPSKDGPFGGQHVLAEFSIKCLE